jgi:predicted  nucleic acid-binding Zn-ribbon protein
VTDDVRIADLLAHALATTRPVDQVVLPRHLVDRLHREMEELTRRAETAEAELAENTGVMQALRRQRDTAEQHVQQVRDWAEHTEYGAAAAEVLAIIDTKGTAA